MGDLRNLLRVMGSRIGGIPFNPAHDIPSMAGKVILITGAAGDLGRVTATELARYGRPDRIYVADLPPKTEDGKQEIIDKITKDAYDNATPKDGKQTEIRFLDLDLGSFESIQRCAADFQAREQKLDILMLNAGIMRLGTGLTQEGYECHFGINYVGHALFIKLLMPVLLRTAETGPGRPRVIIVSSQGYLMAPKRGILFDSLKTECSDMTYTSRYGQSKLALIHLAKELAERHPQVDVVALHPGRVNTGLGRNMSKEMHLFKLFTPIASFISVDPAEGAKNHLWTASTPTVVSGKYYEPVGIPDRDSNVTKDTELRKKLWTWTEDELKRVDVSGEQTQVPK